MGPYSVTNACTTFPEMPDPMVCRESLLETIESQFDVGVPVVEIEGSEGSGRTILLAQFASRHPQKSIGLFLRGTARWAYDWSVLLYDLAGQLELLLHGVDVDESLVDEALVRTRLFQLQKRARRLGETYYFVIDGLGDIPAEESHVRDRLIQFLPAGATCFRFLVSNSGETLCGAIFGSSAKSILIPRFSTEDALVVLGPDVTDRELISRLNRLCRGMPGSLAAVSRLAKTGADIESLISGPHKGSNPLLTFLEREWRVFSEEASDLQLSTVALLAHDRRPLLMTFLAQVMGTDVQDLAAEIRAISFLETDQDSGSVSFVSETMRHLAAERLEKRRGQVIELVIERLQSGQPSQTEALTSMPGYLAQAGRPEALFDFLSTDYVIHVAQSLHSLLPAEEQIEHGIEAAARLPNDEALIRLALNRSMLLDLDQSTVFGSEIEALVALGDRENALNLTQEPALKEDRLALLGVLAKASALSGLVIDHEIEEAIEQLSSQIDFRMLGDRAVSIATDLVHAAPGVAVRIVEEVAKAQAGQNALDWAYVKLSLAKLSAEGGSGSQGDLPIVGGSPDLRRFVDEVSAIFRRLTAKEVIDRVSALEGVGEKLFFLRQWLSIHREDSEAPEVLEYALDTALTSPSYSPNAQMMRELATPLRYIANPATARKLVGMLDSHSETLRRNGPTEDYLRLQLLVAEAEATYSSSAARNRLLEIYYEIADIGDLALKTGCSAHLLSTSSRLDPQLQLEEKEGLKSLVREELVEDIGSLLQDSAEHEYAAKAVVRALAQSEPWTAMGVVASANAEFRRNRLYYELASAQLRKPSDQIDFAAVWHAIESISYSEIRDRAILTFLERFVAEENVCEAVAQEFLKAAVRAEAVTDASERCRAMCLIVRILGNNTVGLSLPDVPQKLKQAWGHLPTGWAKVDLGYRIAGSVAQAAPELARQFLETGDGVRDHTLLSSGDTAWTMSACIRLAIRAFRGLIPTRSYTSEDEANLGKLIQMIPSPRVQAELWSELALTYRLQGLPHECRRIGSEQVAPAIDKLPGGEQSRTRATIECAPSLYLSDKTGALRMFGELEPNDCEEALTRICEFLIHRTFASDPYDSCKAVPHRIPFEDADSVCEVLGHIATDGAIYYVVSSLTSHIQSREYRVWYTREQMASLTSRLRGIVSDSLPDPRNIKHDGYSICCEALIGRVDRPKASFWAELADRARRIPNLADRVFVLCVVASCLPDGQDVRREEVLLEAAELVEGIPTDYDRIDRLELIATHWRGSSVEAQGFLRRAMTLACSRQGPEAKLTRRIVDLAHALDPEFGSSLASLIDDDPARSLLRFQTKERLEILGLRKRILAGESFSEGAKLERLCEAAWQALTSLKSGRAQTLRLEALRGYIEVASKLPLSESYPIYAWVFENVSMRFAKADQQASTVVRGFFGACMSTATLLAALLGRALCDTPRRRSVEDLVAAGGMLVGPSEREDGMHALTEWLAAQPPSNLKICDPYFAPDDIGLLKLIASVSPDCHVQVLSSAAGMMNMGFRALEDRYRAAWRERSDCAPPDTDIVLVRTRPSGKAPIHDRWWLTPGRGLALGASVNQFGVSKWTSLHVLGEEELVDVEGLVGAYLDRKTRSHDGEALEYHVFTL